MKKRSYRGLLLVLAGFLFLTACQSGTQLDGTTASVAAVAGAEDSKLAAAYTANDRGDELLLTISGSTAVLTRQSSDGRQSREEVTIDATHQTMTIRGDKAAYRLDKKELTITEKEAADLFEGGYLVFYEAE